MTWGMKTEFVLPDGADTRTADDPAIRGTGCLHESVLMCQDRGYKLCQ